MMAHVEAITVCVGYADFLKETALINRPHFARHLIVTTEDDTETRDFCHACGLETLLTDDFYKDGSDFDKAKAIDRGMQQLAHKDWVVHLDADIVLPGTFSESLEDAHVDEKCLYGADRFMVRGWDRWQRLKASGFLDRYARNAHHNVCFPEGFPVGARWADVHAGYVPIGYFQMYHARSVFYRGVRIRRYAPHGHNDAARTDVQFGLGWDRRQRVLLPEVVVAHLESVPGPGASVGANWRGRTTPRFGPPPGPETPRPVS